MGLLKSSKNTFIVTIYADFLGFLTGAALAWTLQLVDRFRDEDDIDQFNHLWIYLSMLFGVMFAPLGLSFFLETRGRRCMQLVLFISFLSSFIVLAFANYSLKALYMGLFIMGVGIGGTTCVLLIFLAELAEDKNRGLLLGSKTFSIVLGLLFAYVLGPLLSTLIFNLCLAVICIFCVLVFWGIVPESPYYLLMKNKEEEAYKSLECLRCTDRKALDIEFEKMKNNLQAAGTNKSTYLNILNILKKAFLYVLAAFMVGQVSGVSFVAIYIREFVSSNWYYSQQFDNFAVLISVIQVAVSGGNSLLLDRLGRKCLFLISVVGIVLAEIFICGFIYLQASKNVQLEVIAFAMYLVSISSGLGTILWVIIDEVIPINTRAKVSTYFWFLEFLSTVFFAPIIIPLYVGSTVFWILLVVCAGYLCFVFFLVFETQCKNLQQNTCETV